MTCSPDDPPVPLLLDRFSCSLLSCVALQDFREPLYLTDTITQIEDVRSPEERKYPQLFRHKLKGVADLMHTW